METGLESVPRIGAREVICPDLSGSLDQRSALSDLRIGVDTAKRRLANTARMIWLTGFGCRWCQAALPAAAPECGSTLYG
jgi:hypothetical protein